jgi:hypothetical protein
MIGLVAAACGDAKIPPLVRLPCGGGRSDGRGITCPVYTEGEDKANAEKQERRNAENVTRAGRGLGIGVPGWAYERRPRQQALGVRPPNRHITKFLLLKSA